MTLEAAEENSFESTASWLKARCYQLGMQNVVKK
jgi:hypothetical protein